MSVQDLGASSSNHWYPSVALEIRIQGPLVYLPFACRLFNAQHFQRIGRTGFAHLRTAGDDVLVAGA